MPNYFKILNNDLTMSERSFTLPRNFRYHAPMQIPPVSPARPLSMPSSNGVQTTNNDMHYFGSVPTNLQVFTYQNLPIIPLYHDPNQCSFPGRPMSVQSTYSYQIPRASPSNPLSAQMNWDRRTSAFYPAPSPDPSEYLYTHRPFARSASLPPQGIQELHSPLKGKNVSVNSILKTSDSKNNIEKVQLANKIELEEITLSKKSHDTYIGLIIELLPESLDQDVVVVVQKVTFGGLCQKDGRLKRGDRILKVNGYRVKDFDTTIQNFRQLNVTITVARIMREFKRAHLSPITCSLFGYKPALKPSKAVTSFAKGTPRLVKGVDEAKLEVEMISLCRRLEKVRTGREKVQWHTYNVDKQEYVSRDKNNRTIRINQKKATKHQDEEVNKHVPQVQHLDTQHKLLDKALTTPKELKAAYHKTTTYYLHTPIYRPVSLMQPCIYWAPAVPMTHFDPFMQMKQMPLNHPPFPNKGIFPQSMSYPRNRHKSVPYYFRQGKGNGSLKKSPIKQRSSNVVEETLL